MPKTPDYILFVTQFWHLPHEAGSTGGTISNYFFFRSISKRFRVVVLVLGQRTCVPASDCNTIEVIHSPYPTWGGLELLLKWKPFIEDQLLQSARQSFRTQIDDQVQLS
jgi:hypothetical protein